MMERGGDTSNEREEQEAKEEEKRMAREGGRNERQEPKQISGNKDDK